MLNQLSSGELEVDSVVDRLDRALQVGPIHSMKTIDSHVDLDRKTRCGFPEVVYAEGKTAESVLHIFEALFDSGQDCLATRVSPSQANTLLNHFADARHNPVARVVSLQQPDTDDATTGRVTVITAGASDRPIAEEAVETLQWMRVGSDLIFDVGVAGPHRLGEHLEKIQNVDAIVVVAGMEGALPSVVGGFADCPVIAVPTSVGYGASFGGVSALLGMLNSCASNVTVVNIDAGFKASYVAALIA